MAGMMPFTNFQALVYLLLDFTFGTSYFNYDERRRPQEIR